MYSKYLANRFRPIAVHRFKPIKLIRLEEREREGGRESNIDCRLTPSNRIVCRRLFNKGMLITLKKRNIFVSI